MSRLLIFSATTGYRHESIPAGVAAMRELGEADGFAVDATEDAAVFTPDKLARYSAVVFMNSSGTLFDDAGRSALRGYVAGGGGYLGVHLAAGTEYDWPYYGGLVGAYFDKHPEERFVSDGDPNTITVPAAAASRVDRARWKSKQVKTAG